MHEPDYNPDSKRACIPDKKADVHKAKEHEADLCALLWRQGHRTKRQGHTLGRAETLHKTLPEIPGLWSLCVATQCTSSRAPFASILPWPTRINLFQGAIFRLLLVPLLLTSVL